MCKNLTSNIFSLYLRAPQTWYNLFPSTSIILPVLFISSLLTFIPVACFCFFLFYTFQFRALESLAIFGKHFAFFFLDCFTLLKPETPKFSIFFLSPSHENSPQKSACEVLHDNQHVKISYFLRWSLKKGQGPSYWPNGLYQGHPPCALFTRYLIQWPLISALPYKWRRRGKTTMKPIVIADRVELGSRSSSWI